MTEQIEQKNKHEIDIIEIITMLWKARKFIVIVAAVFLVMGIFYTAYVTPMYRSTITLFPAGEIGGNSPLSAMARKLGVSAGQGGESYYNIPDVVKSRTLSEQIVLHEWKIDGYDKNVTLIEYFDKLRKVEKPEVLVTEEDEYLWNERRLNSYSKMMANSRIFVTTNAETGLISVSVTMEKPKLARDIANFISLFISNWFNDNQKENVKENLHFISQRVVILEIELQETEDKLKKFRETNRKISNSPDLQLELQKLIRRVTLKQEIYLTLLKQKEINQIEENKTTNIVKILDKAIVNTNPIKPRKALIRVVMLMAGLFVGIFAVIVKQIYLFMRKEMGD